MKHLFFTEWKRRFFSFLLLGELILLFVWNCLRIIFTDYGFDVDSVYFLYQNIPFISILITFHILLSMRCEVDNKTILNKLYLGYSKPLILFIEIWISMIESTVLVAFDNILILTLCRYRHYNLSNLTITFLNFIVCVFIVYTISVLITVLACTISSQLIAFTIIIAGTALLLHFGNDTTHTMIQPVKTDAFFSDGQMHPNPLYVTGTKRILYQIHLTLSPYAQAYYADFFQAELSDIPEVSLIPSLLPFHIDFLIVDILEIIVVTIIGVKYFSRKDF
ncbi:MAG: hypothetical protein K6G05_04075 [Lachnospiraceae bacterium]|nr:hypothetical protein [Lachnospiraceae bacterium]